MRRAIAILVAALAGCESGYADPTEGPERLSETGLYEDLAARRVRAGIIAVTPRFPLWSDGAEKRRFLRLPAGARIDTADPDDWRFPVGTQVWKEFSRDGVLLETRLLEKRREPDDGGWFQMAYAWSDGERDATAVPAGVRDVRGTDYDIPAQRDCGQCHYRGEKPLIGLSAMQLDAPSIEALAAAGALSAPPARAYAPPGEPAVAAALGYLHGNCGHCHDERSAAAATVKVFMALRTSDESPEASATYRTLVGQPIHHFPDVGLDALVAPGAPEKSLVHYRMARRDGAQMPPLATRLVDDAGLATVDTWIRGLP